MTTTSSKTETRFSIYYFVWHIFTPECDVWTREREKEKSTPTHILQQLHLPKCGLFSFYFMGACRICIQWANARTHARTHNNMHMCVFSVFLVSIYFFFHFIFLSALMLSCVVAIAIRCCCLCKLVRNYRVAVFRFLLIVCHWSYTHTETMPEYYSVSLKQCEIRIISMRFAMAYGWIQ